MIDNGRTNPRMGVANIRTVAIAMMAMDQLLTREHGMPGIGVLSGPPGLGKTCAMTRLAHPRDINSAYISCRSFDNRKTILEMILKELGVQLRASWSIGVMFETACEQFTQQNRPLVVDESDYIVEGKAINMLRDLHDIGNVPILLVGEEDIRKKLKRFHERLHDRVLVWAAAMGADAADLEKLLTHYTPSLKVGDEVRAALLSKTNGVTRKIVTSLHGLNQLAKTKGLDVISMDHLREVI